MAFINTTWWEDNEVDTTESIDTIVQKIHRNIPEYDDETSNNYVNIERSMAFDRKQEIFLNDTRIEYNLIEFKMDVQKTIDTDENNSSIDNFRIEPEPNIRETTINAFILIFRDESGKINYIIDRPLGDARKMLRRFMNYESRGEITEKEINVTSDFFLWLVYKLFNKENEFELMTPDRNIKELTINAIIGIRGITHDQNTVRADGDEVMNLISTLAFILESESINRVVLKFYYNNIHENIEVRLENNKIAVDPDKYVGEYKNREGANYDYNRMLAQLLLLVYLDIIPNLKNVFLLAKKEGWNQSRIESFIEQVKEKLIERIDSID